MKRVVRVVGARPQFMQVPSIRSALIDKGCQHILIHTGQHYSPSMSENILAELDNVSPDLNLSVGSGLHGSMTGRMMERLEAALLEIRPDFVVVDGDTNSTLATALVTAKLHIPLAHIEAGLRDFYRERPEEVNRVLTDHASDLCLAPIPRALQNLNNEGRADVSVLVGDFLLDNYMQFISRADESIAERAGIRGEFGFMTLHRPENTDGWAWDRFRAILDFAAKGEKSVLFPVHPRTLPMVTRYRAEFGDGKIKFIEPATYLETLGALKQCSFVMTDSGGLSREAVWTGKPCLMLFRRAIWHDLLENGWAKLYGEDSGSLEDIYSSLRTPPVKTVRELFGAGNATQNTLKAFIEKGWL